MPTLSPQENDQLIQMLRDSLDMRQLRRCLYLATGEPLDKKYLAEGQTLKNALIDVVTGLERDQITDQFLDVIYREKPFQFELRAFIARLYPAIAAGEPFERRAFAVQESGRPSRRADAQDEGPAGGVPALQRLIKPGLSHKDLRVWLDRMEAIERQVCRIEANGAAFGTGFLVGPKAVLTNWHVVQEARDQGVDSALACRFDFKRLTTGQTDGGTLIPISTILAESRCSEAEEKGDDPDSPPPKPDELDYALIELPAPLPDRGYIRLGTPPPLRAGAPLIIVQHPEGDAIRFAIDTDAVIGMMHSNLRLRYTTTTEPGSSGSPCLTMDLDIVALHHLGDPRRVAQFNQGIPIGLVRESIITRNLEDRLGI
ncbi:MAG: trypsin-like peptidase domain-containing protein [Rhizobiales bacterium]|nr:trypsin-like peptidase domain-containing protein [Hyphomicrobiales bacterium]